ASDKISHLIGRIEGAAEEYYADFTKNDAKLKFDHIKSISKLSMRLLKSVDYESVKQIRRQNFEMYHKRFGKINELNLEIGSSVPLCYPLLVKNGNSLKQKLIENKIYIPTFWPKVKNDVDADSFEMRLYIDLLPLPLDQRYSEAEINYVINKIEEIGY
ncbi:hypothetical protein ACFLRI_05480, partial [Bacteroidota bacterium]